MGQIPQGGGIDRKALQNKGLSLKTLKKRVPKWDKFHVLLETWNGCACASFSLTAAEPPAHAQPF